MLKKLFFIAFALILYLQWGAINYYLNPPPDYSQAHGGKVIMYATSWCPYCVQAREFLNDNNIEFVEYDIEQSQEGKEQHKRLGGRGVPVFLINGEVVKGFNQSKILALAKSN